VTSTSTIEASSSSSTQVPSSYTYSSDPAHAPSDLATASSLVHVPRSETLISSSSSYVTTSSSQHSASFPTSSVTFSADLSISTSTMLSPTLIHASVSSSANTSPTVHLSTSSTPSAAQSIYPTGINSPSIHASAGYPVAASTPGYRNFQTSSASITSSTTSSIASAYEISEYLVHTAYASSASTDSEYAVYLNNSTVDDYMKLPDFTLATPYHATSPASQHTARTRRAQPQF
jgi:hypothetical protein